MWCCLLYYVIRCFLINMIEYSGKHSVISSSVSLSSTGASNQGGPYSSNQHLEIQFSDTSTKFYCRIYYAQQFRHFRSKVFPAGELRFVRSLSRCVPWAASGGKSGSTFCKTLGNSSNNVS